MSKKVLGFVLFFSLIFFVGPILSSAQKTVVIDPGHGGRDSGAVGVSGNFYEKNGTLSIGLKLKKYLEDAGFTVYMTRDSDKYLTLEERMEVANGFINDQIRDNTVFISIHHNASKNRNVNGIETYYYDGVNHFKPEYPHDPLQIKFLPDSKRLANEVQTRAVNSLPMANLGVKTGQSFFVIRNAQMPSILFELGFVTNSSDEKKLKSSSFQTDAAKAIADGIKNYFKVYEVFDDSGKKLATYKNKNEAIKYAEKQKKLVTVFDKYNQQYIYPEFKYHVYHRTKGYLKDFHKEDDAIAYAKTVDQTRVVNTENDWTIWSNYIEKNYYVYVDNVLYNTFYNYEQALDYASKRTNARLIRKSDNEVLYSNINGVNPSKKIAVNNLAGAYRSSTSASVSKHIYPNGFDKSKEQKVVILATGYDFADALSAGPLSRVYDQAPILLTDSAKLDHNVKAEIQRLKAEKVVIIGGEQAVSKSVENTLRNMGLSIERIGGHHRYHTNEKILEKMGNVNGYFVVSGNSFADALAVAPIAASQNWAIVLSDKDNIRQPNLNYLKDNPALIIGGDAVLSNNVESKVKSTAKSTKRLGGSDRYNTLTTVLWHFNDKLNTNTILVSTGKNFPDALASAPLSVNTNAPLILVGDNTNYNLQSFLIEYGIVNNIKAVNVIGGTLSDEKVREVVNTIQ